MAKKPRRAHGEGTIFWRADRQRWVGSFDICGGKTRSVSGKTQTEAARKLRKAQAKYEQGKLAAHNAEKLETYLESWLATRSVLYQWKPNTRAGYKRDIRLHILPAFGQMRLQQVSREAVQSWVASLTAKFAPRMVRRIFSILHTALQDAMDLEKIAFNPCAHMKLPKVEKYQAQVLNLEQAPAFVENARGSRIFCLLMLALATGMRRGELMGLKWSDINLEKKTLKVVRTVGRVKGDDGKYLYVETSPKSAAGKREILLPEVACEALRTHRVQQIEQQLASANWREKNLVFTTKDGNYFNEQTLYAHMKRILAEAGLPPMRFHDLRHTAATLLIAMGVSPKVVQELLGHADITITLRIYAEVLPSMQGQAMALVDQIYLEKERGS